LATAATGSRSASRMIAIRIAPSESGASLSHYRWSENLRAGSIALVRLSVMKVAKSQ
jgi:hypothetical protein